MTCTPRLQTTELVERDTQADHLSAPMAPTPLQRLPERDRAVLHEIARGEDAQVGFQGIKRQLDLHPEALRRVLKRLQRDGHVEKGDYGYRLTEGGHQLIAGTALTDEAVRPMPVAGLLLPSHLTPNDVITALARRWFDGLRWYGLAESYHDATLTWTTEGGGDVVRMRVGPGRLGIEVGVQDHSADYALSAAAPLVAAVAQLVRQTPAAQEQRPSAS